MLGLHTAATGMLSQQTLIDTISNNLANSNTTGYKSQSPTFHDLLYINRARPGTSSTDEESAISTGIQIGTGVEVGNIIRKHTQGSLIETHNPLNLAIDGHGFFQVQVPDRVESTDGFAYTRDGSFTKGADGKIKTSDGYELVTDAVIPNDALAVTINKIGEIIAITSSNPDGTKIGDIELTSFINNDGLLSIGHNLFLKTENGSGDSYTVVPGEDGLGFIMQGMLESSNVDSITEMVSLIKAQRTYELNSKALQTNSDVQKQANNLNI